MKYQKITISGKICTGKTTLLQRLEKKLGWKTFMTGKLFRDYVKKHHLDLEKAEEQNDELTKKIDNQVKMMLHQKKNLIIDGWMSGFLAKDLADVLKILLICKDDIRYKRFAKRENISYQEAKKRVLQRQRNWFEKIKKIHKIKIKDLNNKKNYDLVIDTSYITPQAVVRKVLQKLKE